MAAILLCVLLQQDQTAFRTEKADYLPAVKECKEAEGLLESDPKGAVEKLDLILNNPKIRKLECRLRIEDRPSEYTPWYAFLPYQYRGRARMNLAKKAEPAAAEKLLSGAAEDFQESVKRGVAASEAHLKTARADLEKLKAAATVKPPDPPKTNPADAFRPGWQKLVDERKFKSALARLATEGRDLAEAERKAFADETNRRCTAHLAEQVEEFRRRFGRLESLRDFAGMSDRAFSVLFELPAPEELCTGDPAYDWARAQMPAFRDLHGGRATADALLPAAAAAAKLEARGENVWFATSESLAFQGVRALLADLVLRSQDLPLKDRTPLRARAESLLSRWKTFADGLDPAFRKLQKAVDSHDAELQLLFRGLPQELAELAKIDVEACFAAASPDAELAGLERRLHELESRTEVTLESRQKLYSLLVTVAALRAMLEGKGEDEAAGALSAYGAKLKSLGGAVDAGKFGPRVAKVFEKLR